MHRAIATPLVLTSLLLGFACDTRDTVEPGAYGTLQAGAQANSASATGASTMGARTTPQTTGTAAGSGARPAATGGMSPSPTAGVAAGMPGAAMKPATPGVASAGPASMGGTPAKEPMTPAAGGSALAPTDDACDLSGRWLMTEHQVEDGLGQLQYIHHWSYFEIERKDAGFAITKGLTCGDDVVAGTAFAASADFKPSWSATLKHNPQAGRGVSSAAASGGCKVQIDKWYKVKGATMPFYGDAANKLPTADQQASGTTPGWEDWDEDGKPGVTGVISGAVSGKIFVASRTWGQLSGMVPTTKAGLLRLDMDWGQEPNLLGYDGSPLLTGEAVRATGDNIHFAQLARLTPEQAAGADDEAICQAIRDLQKTLTPEAAGL